MEHLRNDQVSRRRKRFQILLRSIWMNRRGCVILLMAKGEQSDSITEEGHGVMIGFAAFDVILSPGLSSGGVGVGTRSSADRRTKDGLKESATDVCDELRKSSLIIDWDCAGVSTSSYAGKGRIAFPSVTSLDARGASGRSKTNKGVRPSMH
jgi:hypothetical protein